MGAALMLAAQTAHAAEIAAPEGAAIEELVVLGQGETRHLQIVDGQEIQREVAGASPLKLVEKLPNVNLETADAFGSYEWAARISIRSFGQRQLGFTLDGVPLGDMSYGNFNGLHISRAIAGDNIGQVIVAQGAGGIDTASSSNLGGVLKFISREPSAEFGGLIAATLGSDQTARGFLRLESGELPTGARAYISYSYATSDKFRDFGGDHTHDHVNFKVVQPIGEGRVTAWLNWSERREDDYQDLSLEMIDRLGSGWDNITNNWALAVELAEIGHNRGDTGVTPRFPSYGTAYPAPIISIDDTYANSSGLRDDWIGAVTLDLPVGELLDISATAYGHTNKGQGQWWTPYVASPNYGVAGATTDDAPLSIRSTDYDMERVGLLGSATLTLGGHELNAGFWHESNDFLQSRQFYAVGRNNPGQSTHQYATNPFLTQWQYDYDTTTWKFYVQDTWTVNDRLTLNVGVKSMSVETKNTTLVGPDLSGVIEAKETFLPEAGVRFAINDEHEVFGAFARNMRAFGNDPFGGTQEGFNAIKDTLEPETAEVFEGGWRFRNASFQGLIAAYYVNFHDRLFGVRIGSAIVGNPSQLANVGGVTAKGIEAALDWRLTDNWSVFGSYAYNDSTYDDDTLDGNGVLVARTRGKTTVDTPNHILKAEVAYERDGLFGTFAVSHLTKRYFSYENDVSAPAHTVADLALGYRFSGTPVMEGLEVQVNVTNLFGKDYISSMGTGGFAVRGDSMTLMSSPPRQVFVTVRKAF
jgi:iron complex outermembrane receptor protein